MISGNGEEFTPYNEPEVIGESGMTLGGDSVLEANTDFITNEAPAAQSVASSEAGAGGAIPSFLSSIQGSLSYLPIAATLGFGGTGAPQQQEAPKNGAKPWKSFIGKIENYSLPHRHYLVPRLRANFTNFMWNYILVVAAVFALFALFSSSFFFLMLMMLALWVYLFYWRQTPVELGTFKIELKYIGAVMLACL